MRNRSDLYWIAGLAALITLLFSDILFTGSSLYYRDLARGFYPSARVFHDSVNAGEFPFWNRRYAGGQPFAANPAYMTFYPPMWLTLLPDFHRGFHLAILIHYYIAAIGMYLFLRSCALQQLSSALGAVAWSIGGLLVSLSNLPPLLAAAAWLPLFALFVRRFFHTHRARDFAAASLLLGLILLIGDQSAILQAGALAGAYALYRSRGRLKPAAAALGITALLSITAVAIAAVQIVPAFDLQRDSGRAAPLRRSEASSWSLLPARPLELGFPNVFGRFAPDVAFYWAARFNRPFHDPFILNFYPGMLMTAFMVAGFVRRVRGWPLVAVIAGVSYLMAVFPLAYMLGFKSIRYPEKFWISGMFVLTVFAAIAFDDTMRTARAARTTLLIIAAVAVTMTLFSFTSRYEVLFEKLWQLGPRSDFALRESKIAWPITAGIALVCAFALWLRGRLTPRTWMLLAASILTADLATRAGGLMPRLPRSYYDTPPLALDLQRAGTPIRIFNEADWQWIFSPRAVPSPVKPWFIRNAISPRSYASWGFEGILDLDVASTDLIGTREFTGMLWRVIAAGRRDRVPLLLYLSGATHWIRPIPVEEWRHRNELERMQPVVATALPGVERYYFADQIIITPDAKAFLDRMLEPTNWSRRVAFVNAAAKGGAAGKIVNVRERMNSLALDVVADGDALLVIAVTPHKYWRVTVDNQLVQPLRANLGFQAVSMSKGPHRIEMRYRNDLLVACGVVSAITVAALLALAIIPARKARAELPLDGSESRA